MAQFALLPLPPYPSLYTFLSSLYPQYQYPFENAAICKWAKKKTCWPKERDLSNGIIKFSSSAIYGQSNNNNSNSTTSARVEAQFLPPLPSTSLDFIVSFAKRDIHCPELSRLSKRNPTRFYRQFLHLLFFMTITASWWVITMPFFCFFVV